MINECLYAGYAIKSKPNDRVKQDISRQYATHIDAMMFPRNNAPSVLSIFGSWGTAGKVIITPSDGQRKGGVKSTNHKER